MNKKFKGYFIVGAADKDSAKQGKGLMLWSSQKPGFINRFLNQFMLKIYWVDCEREGNEKGKPLQENTDSTYINKDMPVKYQTKKCCGKHDKCKH